MRIGANQLHQHIGPEKENLGMFQRRTILQTFCTDFARDFYLGQMLSPARGYFLQLWLLDIPLQARFNPM